MAEPFGRTNIGGATIEPRDTVVAGHFGTWVIRYTAGVFGVDDSGHIRITERQVGDWEEPQFDRPTDSGYTTARTNSGATLELAWFNTLNTRPFRKTLVITVANGGLKPGDWIEVTFGDTGTGGPGRRAQTFREPQSEFHVLVDPFGANRFFPVADQPWVPVVGDDAVTFEVRSPASAVIGRAHRLSVRALDKWGNTDENYSSGVSLSANLAVDGLPESATFEPSDRGVIEIDGIVPTAAGDLVFTATGAAPAVTCASNPVRCTGSAEEFGLFWGDFHGQSRESVGTISARDYILYARNDAAVDFVGHQANDFQVTNDFWAELQGLMQEFHDPGRFVTFLGYEWSGISQTGGDRNVHFLGDTGEIRRSSHALLDDLSDADTDVCPVSELHEAFAGREDVLMVPHVGGRHANLDWHDPVLEPVIEIHSSHGTFEWLGREAVERGYRVGFICGSDVHTGRPGACRPSVKMGEDSLGVRGGLAGVFAKDLSREAIFAALRARRCYGTTGARIRVWVECDGQPMGADLKAGRELRLSGGIRGTAPIQSVELLRSWEVIDSVRPRHGGPAARRLRITWTGAAGRGRRRSTTWTGSLRVEGAHITAHEPVGFDHLGEGLRETSNREITWMSRTEGDFDGLEIELDRPEDAALQFDSPIAAFRLALADIPAEGSRRDAGGETREVRIEWVDPAGDDTALDFEFTVPAAEATPGAYFLRVLQKDCEMAWTSPYYLDA
ncbi:MAG: DUF3604 domain-containing protein [Chloroflexota bacterium]|nr:DUF3604 domain-containing protein [Chloroflexota bacterium]MDP6507613.1 DUF3604 domain-containing protein [Chloroflexota bacterium]MDP6757363.1 DUF3604 domain-containing protein [Chloroflexota bacterium]